ncbi:HsdR family type I site-specific deoxyribonuclease [Fibrobacter sp.]|uniref:HsdR family type I site-specific deoxyribonuclease n=1 Tax=Fibrobacter sp. TaxID=35828 RepID=UPI00388EA6A7
MPSLFTEATRVQLTAIQHLARIGYTYLGKIPESAAVPITAIPNSVFSASPSAAATGPAQAYDPDTNILVNVFAEQFAKLNPNATVSAKSVLSDIQKELDDDDLGQQFYKRITSCSPLRLIDFDHPENNVYHCTAEFTCRNGEDNFRPDITLFINGLPLVFIEVKKPNNAGGMVAESKRMNEIRFPNKKFRRFINITQLMIFSNNMEYDAKGGVVPVEGVFYCTAAKESARFNCFREENPKRAEVAPFHANFPYLPISPELEKRVLMDFNVPVLKENPEYKQNLNVNSPTNRVLTSMVSPERLLFLLKYGIAYLHIEKEVDGQIESRHEKHIMRYQQFFAAMIIREKLATGVTSGVVWHTQGSGKTALSFHLSKVLKDYFAKRNKVAKFYFIVDRLDLLEQATEELGNRGLKVTTANSRTELMEQFRTMQALQGNTGVDEITVVNIQKFENDTEKVELPNYATNLQRVFIMDEAHRGYKPNGCFLSNLFNADKNAIKIALTGTPLIGSEKSSCKVFGDYFHTYYYDRSIQDGYTLKIIREDIETSYRKKLNEAYENVQKLVEKGSVSKNQIIEHPTYVKSLLRYIINDLVTFRAMQGDNDLGGMVICESSEQARKLFASFEEIQNELNENRIQKINLKAGLILFDSDDKETRKQIVSDFKKNYTIDILIVFNMLLTGFDAPRLKRLYFGRKIKDHNLLQAITRVNRPYKNMKRGFLIDFADIKQNFDETNAAYLQELNRYNADDDNADPDDKLPDMYSQVMEDKDTLINQMKVARQALFSYTTDNAEVFSTEISSQEDKKVLIELRKALELAKDAMNLVRTFGDDALKKDFEKLSIEKLPLMLSEVNHRIAMINQKEAWSNSEATQFVVNEAMMNIEFNFNCIGTEELKIIDGGTQLREKYKRALRGFLDNFDHEDPEFIDLEQEFKRIFDKHGFTPENLVVYNEQNQAMDDILKRLEELRKMNEALLRKYNGDTKFAYVHKRIREENKTREVKHKEPIISKFDEEIVQALLTIKRTIDAKVFDRNDILKQDAYFGKTVMKEIADGLTHFPQITPEMPDYIFIRDRVAKQYINQYNTYYGN